MSFNSIAVQVAELGKCYQIYNRPQDRLKQAIIPRLQTFTGRSISTYYHEFWALQDISFEIHKGETVGIVGRNGSGKSTLLQLISGTLTPTTGWIQTHGRLAALLELGSGFNLEFTGRENIYLNGAILGLTPKEIDNRFDDIAAFADIGEFIEQPVKMYSSGMYVRLAFAINIMSQPDIMIVDEALAVGDMNFQAKCITALKRRQESGTTVLFVSHDINSVKGLCSRAIYLEQGRLKSMGTAAEVSGQYLRTMREELNTEHQKASKAISTHYETPGNQTTAGAAEPTQLFKRSEDFEHRVAQFRYGTGEARVTYVELLDVDNEPTVQVEFDQPVKISIYLEAYQEKSLSVNFNILDDKKNLITGANFLLVDQPLLNVQSNERYHVEYMLRLPLRDGNYAVQVALTEPVLQERTASFVDYIDDAVVFKIGRWEKAKLWAKVFLFPSIEVHSL